MLDLLRATSELYGSCSQHPDSTDIFINGVLVTEEQMVVITAKATETELNHTLTEYSRLRKAEYDKLNQDEMRFDDEINNTTTWVDTILAIKEQYPKP